MNINADDIIFTFVALGVLGLCIWLLSKSWVWILISVICGLASFFSMVASIIHFQILGALGYCLLLVIWGAVLFITLLVMDS